MPSERIDCFLDTNVLVYAAQISKRDERRTEIARRLALSTVFGVSAQTLAEFYSVVTTKAKVALTDAAADEWIEYLSDMPFQVVDHAVVVRGIELSRQFRIGYYDAALIAAAERLGAPVFYSEDLNHRQRYGAVTVLNPFLES